MSLCENNRGIELGFIQKIESWKLQSKYFPSKIGGCPAWLELENLPEVKNLSCNICSKPLVFLCQIYAPFHSKDECFHRTIFIFICHEGNCSIENSASNIVVLRSQLPRENKFYSDEPSTFEAESTTPSPSASDYNKLCRVCGCFGSKKCSKCKNVTYCSVAHQRLDWIEGHKMECCIKETLDNTRSQKKLLFPEYEIDSDIEDLEDLDVEKSDEQIYKEYEEMLKKGQIPSYKNSDAEANEDVLEKAAKETDLQFATFRTRIEFDTQQISRYDRGGIPLWVNSKNKPSDVSDCELCGAKRQFEFQLMPQLLVHLKVDSLSKSLDWGTILIYSCSESCSIQSYAREVAFKQDYSPDRSILLNK